MHKQKIHPPRRLPWRVENIEKNKPTINIAKKIYSLIELYSATITPKDKAINNRANVVLK